MAFPRDRNNYYRMEYEDADRFGEDVFNGAPAGITSLPIQQPIQPIQPTAQPIAPPVPNALTNFIAPTYDIGRPPDDGIVIEEPFNFADYFKSGSAPAPTVPDFNVRPPIVERDPFNPNSGIITEEPFNYSNFLDVAPPPTFNSGSEPVGEKLVQDVTELPTLTPVEKLVQDVTEPPKVEPPPTGVFGLPITPVQPPAQPEPAAPVAPTGPDPKAIDSLTNQILGQGLTGKWSGEGLGSAEKNASEMAKILAGIGITDIKQFGKVPLLEQAVVRQGYNGQAAQQDEDGNYFIVEPSGQYDNEGNQISTRVNVDPSKLEKTYGFYKQNGSTEEEGSSFVTVDPSKVVTKDGVPMVQNGETFGNKLTGQVVPNTYSERQTGNFFGGTFAGKGNTGYGVQFDSQGNPVFYTQGASSNDLANLMKELGPVGQIAIAALTGGMSLPAQLATNAGIQLLAGGNLKDIAKGTALSYLGGQAGNLISGSSGITDLLGKTGSDIASRTAQQFVGSGGKADIGQALLGSALSSGINSTIGDIPGLDSLSSLDKNMTANLISAIATGTPIDQAIQNAIVGKASSEARNAVAEARSGSDSTSSRFNINDLFPSTKSQDQAPSPVGQDTADQTVNQDQSSELLRMLNPYLSDDSPSERTLPVERASSITDDKVEIDKLPFDATSILSNLPPEYNIDDLLASIQPKTIDQDKTDLGPGNDELAKILGIDENTTGSLINNAPTDTLVSKETAAEPAIAKGKAMDDIDFSQVPGDYGPNLLDELRNSMTDTGNASSLFSGDGGIDLSALGSIVNDDGTTEGIQDTINSFTPEKNTQGYYDEISGKFVPDPLGGLSNPLGDDVGNIDPDSKWEYSQTRPGVWVSDSGDIKDLRYLPNSEKTMTGAQIMKKAGVAAGSGGKSSTSTAKAAAKPGTSPGTNNNGMIMALMAMMAMMNSRGSGGSSAASSIPALSANRSQLPYAPTGRPGAGGQNYFSPTTFTPKAAGGGLMGLAAGGMSNLGGYSDGGRLLKGPGDGVSDSIPATIGGKQPARLATGEFVVPARIVSELGNGSTEAGAKKLYAMMDRVQKARRKTKNVAADTKAHKYLPA